jgi:hypothetical protein
MPVSTSPQSLDQRYQICRLGSADFVLHWSADAVVHTDRKVSEFRLSFLRRLGTTPSVRAEVAIAAFLDRTATPPNLEGTCLPQHLRSHSISAIRSAGLIVLPS